MSRRRLLSLTAAALIIGLSSSPAKADTSVPDITLAAFDAGTNLKAAGQVSTRYPLHAAAVYDRPEMARQLVEGGMPVDMRNDGGLTALMTAATFGNQAVAEELIRLGADIGTRNAAGHTALHIAALAG